MARWIEATVTEKDEGSTVRHILRNELHMASSLISRLKLKPQGICLNGEKVYTNVLVRAGDVVSADVEDSNPWNPAKPIDYPLDIKYIDEDLIVISKPAGMAVHGSDRIPNCTVANAYAAVFGQKCSFHPVNRLDKGVSGLILIARNAYMHDRLRRLMHTEHYVRIYTGIADGIVTPPSGTITLPITKHPVEGIRREISPTGIASVTDYKTLQASKNRTMLKIIPRTGRTHQIRLHFSAIGYPLTGDPLYGNPSEEIDRPALHSAEIHLDHPITGVHIHIADSIPEDMRSLL